MSADLTDELTHKLTFRWADFQPVTAGLLGTGGTIRQELTDFEVEEVPLYKAQGSGSHAYAFVEKRGLTTRDLVTALMAADVAEKSIGVAGLKDKYAVTRQWLSVPQRDADKLEVLANLDDVDVLERSRHKNKLAIGHLAGNRFRVRVRNPEPDALVKAENVIERLRTVGVPNYFGPQRFGRGGTNAIDGYKYIKGEWVPGGQRLKRFFVSALQSLVFNYLLNERVEDGIFDDLILGDWAKKHDTGGVFRVDDKAEGARAKSFAVSATLPLYGKKVKLSEAEAGERELGGLEHYQLRWLDFTSRKGDRRLTRFPLTDTELIPQDDGYTLSFFLPKGAFATSLLREVMKVDVDAGS